MLSCLIIKSIVSNTHHFWQRIICSWCIRLWSKFQRWIAFHLIKVERKYSILEKLLCENFKLAPIFHADLQIWITVHCFQNKCCIGDTWNESMNAHIPVLSIHFNQTMPIYNCDEAYRLPLFPFVEHFNKYEINTIWKHSNMKLWHSGKNVWIFKFGKQDRHHYGIGYIAIYRVCVVWVIEPGCILFSLCKHTIVCR